jgi:hypothetical protein
MTVFSFFAKYGIVKTYPERTKKSTTAKFPLKNRVAGGDVKKSKIALFSMLSEKIDG